MNSEVDKYLNKVLESNEFKGSVKSKKLLEYLVKSSLSGIIPKEITIAYEVFNIEYDSSATGESNIRVYIYNLRKKLEVYYAEEGKDDTLRFLISKGAYKVEFIQHKKFGFNSSKRSRIIFIIIISLLLLGNIAFTSYYFFSAKEVSYPSKYIWKDFLSSDIPVLVVVGDYYLIKDGTYLNRVRYIRDSRINSDDDLTSFSNEFPVVQTDFYKTRHTLFGKFAPFCINDLNNFFALSHRKFEIIMASDFQWHDIQKYNIVYIGSFKSLGLLKNLLKESNFEFFAYPNELKYHQLKPDSVYHYYSFDSNVDNALESDFSVVTKVHGTNETNILFFLSTRDIGLFSMIKYFTNQDSLRHFENSYLKASVNPTYFESCFKILGLHRTTKSVELLHVNTSIPSK